MRAVVNHKISTRVVHFDTTSVNVYGEYRVDEASPPPFEIVEGYSKDHRPDLKQFLISTLCVGSLTWPFVRQLQPSLEQIFGFW